MKRPVALILGVFLLPPLILRGADANRLTYLDEFSAPFYPSHAFPKLVTPQWVGEPGVEAVVTYGIDDMSGHAKYEAYLRPILERLKQIDGRAPVSIFCNSPTPAEPHLQQWLREGVTLEAHTLSHPCPILAQGNFTNAQHTFHGCVELLNRIPGNVPVAFRTPCMDSINSASPRLFAEIFARTNSAGQFLRLDSSVMMVFTPNDPALPRERLVDAQGRPRFQKYVPFEAFGTTVENYPFPFVHTRLCWEMPSVSPDDWQSYNLQGDAHPQLVEDWKVALDLIVQKQGTFNHTFHPANWSVPTQHLAFIDYAVATYGSRVKFLNYREVHDRLTQHLLAGQPLRASDGGDNGVRLLDLNHDGYLDVVIGNDSLRRTRVWDPGTVRWNESEFPTRIAATQPSARVNDLGVRFGIVGEPDQPVMLVRNEREAGAWRFGGGAWISEPALLNGLELDGKPVLTASEGRDLGVRLRDVDGDGVCELIVANESQNAVFAWAASQQTWKRAAYALPPGATIVNAQGQDNGLRFVDLNEDGADDVVFSNDESFSIHLMVPQLLLGFQPGWSREVLRGRRGQLPELPRIVRAGPAPNNGAWFTRREMFVQNENTAHLPRLVERHSFAELLSGLMPAALTPTQSLAAIQVPTNFVVELVAHEPLVQDPVFLEWGADGKLWVVEMRDYPAGVDGKGKAGGAIRVLEDRDGDGRYEHSTVFAEGLNFPNGLLPWRKGVLISAAPDILYAEDTDGDGKADKFEKLFTGFGEGNQQHRFNGFEYGLDNWLYGANGDSGGNIRSLRTGRSVSIGGRDFRFRPDTGELEAVEGQTQFGRHRDDWGNWFGNANPVWLWHYWLPERYLRRNPRLAVESLRRETATHPGAGRVYPIGRKQQRMNDIGAVGYVTSANSPTPYRDDLFGPAFARGVFISEPVHNLVRCEVLEPDGVSFTSQRWNAESAAEFLSSTDPWFRPTGLRIGPDGALYIADMYRQFIEHPEWIPDDIKTRYNLRAGEDKGRIYRVYPKGATLRPPPRLDRLATAELVATLDHPNGWQRDTVQRLLVTRADPAAVEPLRKLLGSSANPKARLSALCTLDGLGAMQESDLARALGDAHPGVREHAVRLCEPSSGTGVSPVRIETDRRGARATAALLARVDDPDLRVRYQLAFTLGEWDDPRAAQAFARLTLRDADHADVLTAIASSATKRPVEILDALLAANIDLTGAERLVRNLVTLVAARGNEPEITSALTRLAKPSATAPAHAAWQISAFAQFLQEFEATKRPLLDFKSAAAALPALLTSARQLAADDEQSVEHRASAITLLGRDAVSQSDDATLLVVLLSPRTPDALQRAALNRLGQMRSEIVPVALAKGWSGYSPSVRAQALDLLLRREKWARALLERLEAKELAAEDLGAGARQRLLAYPSEELRERARRILAQPVHPERQKLIAQYLPAVQKATGNANRGAAQFAKHCAVCHRLNQQGTGAAPDLATVVDRSPERMLIAILDPNRAVEDRYLNYVVRTKAGDEFSGMLAGESANNITLVGASGARETLLRSEIDTLTSTRLSIMPEGFEQFLQPPDLADLLAFLDTATAPPRSFAGNRPAVVKADAEGALRLRAANAEIHGDGIAFESQYKNLGSWNSVDARAAWTVQVPAAGAYDVWLHWACHDNEAGDTFRFQLADAAFTAKVPGTVTWDFYKAEKFGRVNLPAGQQRAVFQAEAPLRAYLIDLLEVRLVPASATAPPKFDDIGSAHAAVKPAAAPN